MSSGARPAEKTLLCLGFDELAAVAGRLDYKSLGSLSCVSKGLRESLSAMVRCLHSYHVKMLQKCALLHRSKCSYSYLAAEMSLLECLCAYAVSCEGFLVAGQPVGSKV